MLSLGSAAAGTINTYPIQQEIEIEGVPEVSPSTTQTIQSPKVQSGFSYKKLTWLRKFSRS
ncbi:hypothetical protein [Bernardetia sp. MNP-M8]|uniref:hypothetical protein n=1 Tax=Bernardetia sp. MNP-M8 TaxID=3127470 RepID=UPI0030CE307E